MAMKDLRKVAPMWVNVSHAIFDDKEAHEARTQLPQCLLKYLEPRAFLRQELTASIAFCLTHCHISWVTMGHSY